MSFHDREGDKASSVVSLLKEILILDFPGGPGIKTPCFHFRVHGSTGQGNKISHAAIKIYLKKKKDSHAISLLYIHHKAGPGIINNNKCIQAVVFIGCTKGN